MISHSLHVLEGGAITYYPRRCDYESVDKVYVLPYMVPVLAGKKVVLAGVDCARTGVLGVIIC